MEASETYKRCVAYKYYLLAVQTSGSDGAVGADSSSVAPTSARNNYLKPGHLVELDPYSCIFSHGSDISTIQSR